MTSRTDTMAAMRRYFRLTSQTRSFDNRIPSGFAAALRLGHPASAIAAAWLSHHVLRVSPVVGLLTLPLVWLFIGSRFRALGNMMHECAHRTFVRSVRANRVCGHLLGFFDFTDYGEYVTEHFTHHRHLGDPETDLDFKPRRELFEALGPLSWRYLRFGLLLRHVPHFINPIFFNRGDSWPVGVARATFNLGLLALAHFVIGWQSFFLYYVVPYATTYQMFRFFSDALDHAGVMAEPDEFQRSRNHIHAWPWVNWLLFPRHDQFHLVHHILPQIPCGRLKQAHEILLGHSAYGAREHDLTRLFRSEAPLWNDSELS